MPGDFVFSQFGPVCEIGLGAVRGAEPDSWFDVSCHVIQAETFRGHERFNERFEPGTASVVFENKSGWADLVGDAWAVATALMRAGRAIRIGVRGPFDGGPVVTRWLWRGWIDQVAPAYEPKEGLTDTVTINCIDALGEAGQAIAVASRDLVGVHETASARINRVLDAVGWFPAKRKVAAVPTLVQGTKLGSQAMDLMTVAADTAGGVVFGDLDGDVVFKGIDWMLYKPTDPPDGTIGNTDAPKPPLPGQPPYLDPVDGTVYYDNGVLPRPECIAVCVAPAEGTVVEQGDAWRIYMHNGHLWYESSGHLWDMGVWNADDQCTNICKKPGQPPTRHDPGDIEEPSIGTLASWEFTVDFLGYTDGNIADGAKQYVAVPGLAPGPDCLVVVLISAIADTIPLDGSLAPYPEQGGAVSGGGLTWKQIAINDRAGLNGAESYAVAAEVGRNDPGAFAVVVDWAHEYASRTHVVTAWRVKGYRKDMLQRMTVAAYLHGSTHDLPGLTGPSPPGKGPQAVPFVTIDTAGTKIVPGTRATDITIAQSLAEEPTGPFGASFNDADGAWITPAFAGGAVAATDVVCDDFERANGPLGAAWANGPGAGWADEVYDLTISGGAAIGTHISPSPGSFPYVSNAMSWATAQTGDQSIEVIVENVWSGLSGRYVGLSTNMSAGSDASYYADFNFDPAGFIGIASLRFHSYTVWDSVGGVSLSHAVSEPIKLRLESKVDGTQLVYVDDVLVLTAVAASPVTGSLVGFSLDLLAGTTSPRVLQACIGGTGGIVRKCSWVAGHRQDALAVNSAWTEVNTGPANIQSAQVEVVMESGEDIGFAWRTLAYGVFAPTTGLPAGPGSRTVTIRPERVGKIIVFVGFTKSGVAATADVNVTSSTLTFTRLTSQGPSGGGWAQGTIFTATLDNAPTDLASPPTVTVAWASTVDKIGFAVIEVANADSFGSHASAVAGNHASGSVAGGNSITFSPAPTVGEVAIGFLFGADLNASANGSLAGPDMTTELQANPTDQYAWIHVQTRDSSTSNTITWSLMDASTPREATDVVMLGVIVKPLAAFADWSTFDTVVIGGSVSKYNAPIYSAAGTGPGGTPIWAFDPSAPNGIP